MTRNKRLKVNIYSYHAEKNIWRLNWFQTNQPSYLLAWILEIIGKRGEWGKRGERGERSENCLKTILLVFLCHYDHIESYIDKFKFFWNCIHVGLIWSWNSCEQLTQYLLPQNHFVGIPMPLWPHSIIYW